jgi:hypothetical protein
MQARAELLSLVMAQLDAGGLDRGEDAFRAVLQLQLLLSRFPGDMAPEFQTDMAAFFTATLLPALGSLQCAHRLNSNAKYCGLRLPSMQRLCGSGRAGRRVVPECC